VPGHVPRRSAFPLLDREERRLSHAQCQTEQLVPTKYGCGWPVPSSLGTHDEDFSGKTRKPTVKNVIIALFGIKGLPKPGGPTKGSGVTTCRSSLHADLGSQRRTSPLHLSSCVTLIFTTTTVRRHPLNYKRGSAHEHKRTSRDRHARIDRRTQTPAHTHDTNHRDLGAPPSLDPLVLAPASFSIVNTSSWLELDVGTQYPNQYNPHVSLCTISS